MTSMQKSATVCLQVQLSFSSSSINTSLNSQELNIKNEGGIFWDSEHQLRTHRVKFINKPPIYITIIINFYYNYTQL